MDNEKKEKPLKNVFFFFFFFKLSELKNNTESKFKSSIWSELTEFVVEFWDE